MTRKLLVTLLAILIMSLAVFRNHTAPTSAQLQIAQSVTPSPSPSVNPIFNAVAARLMGETAVPLYLPATIPFPPATYYADIVFESRTEYGVEISPIPNCGGSPSCQTALIAGFYKTGGSPNPTPPLTGTPTTLANGTTAYYNPSTCGAGCTANFYVFQVNGNTYTTSAPGNNPSGALALANSLVPYVVHPKFRM